MTQRIRVKTVPLSYGRISETLTAHGIVEPLPSTIETYNVTFECLVTSVLVTEGQVVKPGDLLLIINPSPETQLMLEQVQDELESARLEEEFLNDRIKLKLATKQDLVPIRLRVSLAQRRLESLKERGVESMKEIRAASVGLVYFIGAQPGQTLPAGTNLLQLAHEDQIIVRLGVESEDFNRLLKGQSVRLRPILSPNSKAIEGNIQTVTRQVDPSTRLVNINDVATVSRGTMPQWTRVNADGHEAVLFQAYQQPGGNTVHITDECSCFRANA